MPKFDVRPESFTFSTAFPTLWGDQDALGHINHARYLTYFEQARCEYVAGRGVSIPDDSQQGPVVAHIECRYRAPVKFPAMVRVYLRPTLIKQSVFRMEYAIYNDTKGELAADGSALLIWTDLATGRRVPLPEVVLERLREKT